MKENIKKNKNRIIIWGIIALLSTIFSISGIISYKTGNGTVGSIRIQLVPIVDAFNDLDAVIRNGSFKAECDGTKIVVTYTNKAANRSQEYIYEYMTKDDIAYISNFYSNSHSEIGDFIAENMVDAIYKQNGGKGKVSDTYKIKSFSAMSLKDGAEYSRKNEITTVNLNIKTNILANASKLEIETIQESESIRSDDLKDMIERLQKEKVYKLSKNNNTIYVKDSDEYYDIYLSCTNDEVLRRTAASIVYILKPTLYEKLDDGTGKLDFNIQLENDYQVREKPNFNEPGIFKNTNNLFELIIIKQKNIG